MLSAVIALCLIICIGALIRSLVIDMPPDRRWGGLIYLAIAASVIALAAQFLPHRVVP
jgi:hypothetical protein